VSDYIRRLLQKNLPILNRKRSAIYIGLTLGKREVLESKIDVNSGVSRVNSVIYAKNTRVSLSDNIVLKGENARGEILSKTISDGGDCSVKERIQAWAGREHVECDGLLLNSGRLRTTPVLEAMTLDAVLSHEAAIGKLSKKELIYLMSKGLSEETARSLLIRGFLSIQEDLQKLVDELIERKFINFDEAKSL
jgi:Fe-S cluster assembly scaffold protein SufB